jgi:E3 ubiquitin-protein ligase HERC1
MLLFAGIEIDLSPSADAPHFGPLHLVNALAACVLSARLHSQHRQWAVQQLLRALASQGRGLPLTGNASECLADLTGDLPACPVTKLEAHENRVTRCTYSSKKSLLASS